MRGAGRNDVEVHTEFWWGNMKEGKHCWEDNIKMDVKEIRYEG